jgi:hypothetical protein
MKTNLRLAELGAALMLGIALVGCGGTQASDSSSEAAVESSTEDAGAATQTESDSTTSESSEATSESQADKSEDGYVLGSIAQGAANEYGDPTVSESTARNLFKITLDGVEYQLPCKLQEFYDNGWTLSKRFASAADEMVPSHRGPAGIGICKDGDEDHHITVATLNLTDGEASLADTYVTHVSVAPQNSTAKLALGVGVGSDSSFDELAKVLGYSSGSRDPSDSRVTYSIALIGEDGQTKYGTVSYDVYSKDKSIASLEASMGFNLDNPLFAIN